jgi:hypothetical protein
METRRHKKVETKEETRERRKRKMFEEIKKKRW